MALGPGSVPHIHINGHMYPVKEALIQGRRGGGSHGFSQIATDRLQTAADKVNGAKMTRFRFYEICFDENNPARECGKSVLLIP